MIKLSEESVTYPDCSGFGFMVFELASGLPLVRAQKPDSVPRPQNQGFVFVKIVTRVYSTFKMHASKRGKRYYRHEDRAMSTPVAIFPEKEDLSPFFTSRIGRFRRKLPTRTLSPTTARLPLKFARAITFLSAGARVAKARS